MTRLVVRPGKERALQTGYPWLFANQLAKVDGTAARGDVVQVVASNGAVIGQALYHDHSLIAGRLLTHDGARPIDEAFWATRLDAALARRAAVAESTHARILFGESDGFPGTIVDRYGPPGLQGGVLTFTTLAWGMEARRDLLLGLLEERLKPDCIVERNDAALRRKDGLEERTGVLRGTLPDAVEIEEHGVRFDVDVLHGPKTGFFIDQRDNRAAVARMARGRRVLDVCCADGGFGLTALRAGATSAHFLDVSAPALDRVRGNAEKNGLDGAATYEQADALERIGTLADEAPGQYDLVVLDPPGFAKSRRDLDAATRAYQRLNISAMKLLPPGGFLATASCSQAVSEDDFLKLVRYSARKAGVGLRRLYHGGPPPDHPTLEAMPETHYLSFFLFEVTDDL